MFLTTQYQPKFYWMYHKSSDRIHYFPQICMRNVNRFQGGVAHDTFSWKSIGSYLIGIPLILTFWLVNFAILCTISWSFIKLFQTLGQINWLQFLLVFVAFNLLNAACRYEAKPSWYNRGRIHLFKNANPTHRPSKRSSKCKAFNRFVVQQLNPVSVRDDKEKLELSVDVPGIKVTSLSVSVKNRVLKISGARGEGSFERQIMLDRTVDVENLSANLADGVLTVRAPKVEGPGPVQVPVLDNKTLNPHSAGTAGGEAEIKRETTFEHDKDDEEMKETKDARLAAATDQDSEEELVMVETPLREAKTDEA